jgi:DNA (cytosine-5)-methyltransferase 1
VLSLFSGIGAFEKALENIGIRYDLIGYCEIDKYASKAYSLIHNVPESKNYGDITKIDETKLPQGIDLLTYGFPCQDISIAGAKRGLFDAEGKKTRSGLFFDALRIIEATKPKIAVAENVKNLTSKSMKPVFDTVLSSLEEAGYNNYWQVMNCADYEIPQSRERVLIVSIRKDVDDGKFTFPEPVPLTTCMGDWLEDDVPDSYNLSSEKIAKIRTSNFHHERARLQDRGGDMQNPLGTGLQRPGGDFNHED